MMTWRRISRWFLKCHRLPAVDPSRCSLGGRICCGLLDVRGGIRRGLSGQLRDALALREWPKDLNSLITLAIDRDNHLREQRRERAAPTTALSPPPSLFRLTSFRPAQPSIAAPSAAPSAAPPAGSEPMRVGRARPMPSERRR